MQQARYDRVIAAATEILSAGGQEAVQMKDLAQRAGVSLATLYRYFPSKEYLLLAVALARYQAAWLLVSAEEPSGRHGPRAGCRSPQARVPRAAAQPAAHRGAGRRDDRRRAQLQLDHRGGRAHPLAGHQARGGGRRHAQRAAGEAAARGARHRQRGDAALAGGHLLRRRRRGGDRDRLPAARAPRRGDRRGARAGGAGRGHHAG